MPKAPDGRQYVGFKKTGEAGPGTVECVDLDGSRTPLDPRLDLANHSPDGFQWGYAGSGPTQLALALVADATGDDELAKRTYQRFKFEIVVGMAPHWTMDAANIASFAKVLDGVRAI